MSTSAEATAVKDPFARLKGELNQLEATARERLKGTKLGSLVERAPTLVQKELDAVLDRAGLVRKAALAKAGAAPAVEVAAAAAAAPAAEARADVDVSAEVVAEVAAVDDSAAADGAECDDIAVKKSKKR